MLQVPRKWDIQTPNRCKCQVKPPRPENGKENKRNGKNNSKKMQILIQVTPSLGHHFPSSPLPKVTTSQSHRFPKSLVPKSSLPQVTTSLCQHFPKSLLSATFSLSHHFPKSSLLEVTISLSQHFAKASLCLWFYFLTMFVYHSTLPTTFSYRGRRRRRMDLASCFPNESFHSTRTAYWKQKQKDMYTSGLH